MKGSGSLLQCVVCAVSFEAETLTYGFRIRAASALAQGARNSGGQRHVFIFLIVLIHGNLLKMSGFSKADLAD